MSAYLKSSLFVALLAVAQIGSFLALHGAAARLALALGSARPTGVAFGLTVYFSFWLFCAAAVLLPALLLCVRSKVITILSGLCFLAAWAWVLLPALAVHPYRAGFLLVLGVTLVFTSAWFTTRWTALIRAQSTQKA